MEGESRKRGSELRGVFTTQYNRRPALLYGPHCALLTNSSRFSSRFSRIAHDPRGRRASRRVSGPKTPRPHAYLPAASRISYWACLAAAWSSSSLVSSARDQSNSLHTAYCLYHERGRKHLISQSHVLSVCLSVVCVGVCVCVSHLGSLLGSLGSLLGGL